MAAASEEARRVDLVHLVCLVHLVGLVQPNKRDKPNNSLLTLADFHQPPARQIGIVPSMAARNSALRLLPTGFNLPLL